MKITITANDGKEFKGTNYEELYNECNAYESDQKLKKEKAEAERKAREETKQQCMQRVQNAIDSVNKTVADYEKETGEKLQYIIENGKLTVQKVGYSDLYALGDDLFRQLRRSKLI